MHVDAVEFGLGRDHVTHDVDALRGVPVADLGDDLDLGMLLHHVVEARAAQLRHVLRQVAGDLQDLALDRAMAGLQELRHRLARLLSGEIVVGEHHHVDLAAGGRTVDRVEGDLGFLGGRDRLADAGAVIGHRHDRRDLLGDEIVDVVELLLRVAARGHGHDLPALGLGAVHEAGLDLALAAKQCRAPNSR